MSKLRQKIDSASLSLPNQDLYEWVQCLAVLLVLCMLVFTFFFRVFEMQGNSMVPTLEQGERVLVNRFFNEYKAGDIVVFCKASYKEEPVIKRIIAVGGQTVEIDPEAGVVLVDGVPLEEDYTFEPTVNLFDYTEPVTVPEGCLFVLGDNRNNSQDSRTLAVGCVDERYLLGKVIFRLTPFAKFGAIYGW